MAPGGLGGGITPDRDEEPLLSIHLSDRDLTPGFEHVHTAFLSKQQAFDLMQGIVASVDVESSDADQGGSHTHTTTIKWNSDLLTFTSTSSFDASHEHVDIPAGPQGLYGQAFDHVESVAESTTSSGAYQLKLSYSTPSTLLAGDYRIDFAFGASNDGGKEWDVQVRVDSVEASVSNSETGHQAAAGQYIYQNIPHFCSNISGAHTFDIRFRSPDGDTTRIGDSHIYIIRVK